MQLTFKALLKKYRENFIDSKPQRRIQLHSPVIYSEQNICHYPYVDLEMLYLQLDFLKSPTYSIYMDETAAGGYHVM